MNLRIGQGWDTHRLVEERKLMLGGLEIPSKKGEEAHSDGDVLIHALIDALLGALALGDIGTHFPPSDLRWKDAPGEELLRYTLEQIESRNYGIKNMDCTLVLEAPKLRDWKEKIRIHLSGLLGIPADSLSLKAKTAEGMGPVGEGRAVEAQVVVLLEKLS